MRQSILSLSYCTHCTTTNDLSNYTIKCQFHQYIHISLFVRFLFAPIFIHLIRFCISFLCQFCSILKIDTILLLVAHLFNECRCIQPCYTHIKTDNMFGVILICYLIIIIDGRLGLL